MAATLLVGIVIALISSYVTVILAFRRFSFEKQWERKADAYTKVLIALHQLKDHSVHELRLQTQPDRLPQGSDAEIERRRTMECLADEMNSGISELRLQIDIGTFILNQRAITLLETLMLGLDESIEVYRREQSIAKHYEHKVKVIDECQKGFRIIARDDFFRDWKHTLLKGIN